MKVKELPKYWGVTVDKRLKQFRYVRPSGEIEFLDFKARPDQDGNYDERGENLLARAIREGFFSSDELSDLF